MCCSFILSGQKLALHLEKLPIFQKHAIFSHVCLSFCQCCRLVSVPLLNSAFTLCNGTGSTNRQILCRFTCTCMRARAHVYVYAYMCIWNAYACTYTCTHTCVYVYSVHIHACTFKCACTRGHLHVYTYMPPLHQARLRLMVRNSSSDWKSDYRGGWFSEQWCYFSSLLEVCFRG